MKRFRVLIRSHPVRYDLISAIILKKYLESKQVDVFLTNGSNHRRVVKFWRPHVAVLDTGSKIRETKSICSTTKIILLQNKESDRFCLELPTIETLTLISKIVLWGQKSYECCIEKFGERIKEKLCIIGAPKLDIAKHLSRINKSGKNNTIGIIGNFYNVNQHALRPVIWSCRSEDNIHRTLKQIIQFNLIYKLTQRLIKETNFRISIRPHPYESLLGYEFIEREFRNRLEIYKSMDICEWMNKQCVLIILNKQNLIESNILKIPYINLTAEECHYNFETKNETLGIGKHGDQIIEGVIKRFKLHDFKFGNMYHGKMYQEYNMSAIGKSTDRVGKLIIKVLHEIDHIGYFVPLTAVNTYAYLKSFYEGYRRPLYRDYNYNPILHNYPEYIDDFVKTIA